LKKKLLQLHRFIPVLLILMLFLIPTLADEPEGDAETTETELPVETNQEACMHCHAQQSYELLSSDSSMTGEFEMCPKYVVDADKYYQSVHKTMTCDMCHYANAEYPHPVDGKFAMKDYQKAGCMACHPMGGSDTLLMLEEITAQYDSSVHSQHMGDNFSCFSCHDPHEYTLFARNTTDIHAIVENNNSMCLECHSQVSDFKLMTGEPSTQIIASHSWLPNQARHFRSVRCIECHASIEEGDNVLVQHNIRPKEEAVRNCVECHSQDSRLLSSLYRYCRSEGDGPLGYCGGDLLEQVYVIGANRSETLNRISIILFFITLGGVFIHGILRIFTKAKKDVNQP
jgi:hypothetical protein